MTYITCTHPKTKVRVRTEKVKSIDGILKVLTPRAYCEQCKCYLSDLESPGREVVRFWFVKQDGLVQALATT